MISFPSGTGHITLAQASANGELVNAGAPITYSHWTFSPNFPADTVISFDGASVIVTGSFSATNIYTWSYQVSVAGAAIKGAHGSVVAPPGKGLNMYGMGAVPKAAAPNEAIIITTLDGAPQLQITGVTFAPPAATVTTNNFLLAGGPISSVRNDWTMS